MPQPPRGQPGTPKALFLEVAGAGGRLSISSVERLSAVKFRLWEMGSWFASIVAIGVPSTLQELLFGLRF